MSISVSLLLVCRLPPRVSAPRVPSARLSKRVTSGVAAERRACAL